MWVGQGGQGGRNGGGKGVFLGVDGEGRSLGMCGGRGRDGGDLHCSLISNLGLKATWGYLVLP